LAAAIFLLGLTSARGAAENREYGMTQQIGGAFDSVLAGLVSCGCLVGNRKTECSTQVCNGHRSTGDPDLGSLFCFQPGPFLTASKGFLSTMPEALSFG